MIKLTNLALYNKLQLDFVLEIQMLLYLQHAQHLQKIAEFVSQLNI